MNWRSPKLWISVFSLGAVSLFAVVDMERKSPGPVSTVHGRLEELDGGSSCSACHGGWFSTMTDSCLECHAPIAAQLESKKGLHGLLEPAQAESCGTCHSEHHGTSFALVNDQAFRRAVSVNEAEFDHRSIGFAMDGRHVELGCVECHVHADDSILVKGTPRFLGLQQDCASCHEDVHEGRMRVSCASCHGQTSWDALHSEGHDAFLPLVGGHGAADCRQCHAQGDLHSLENMTHEEVCPTPRDCVACHASPHSEPFVAGNAALAGMPTGASCVSCHRSEHTSFREEGLTLDATHHAPSGFPLTAPHDAAACAKCHDPAGASFRSRHPGRSPDACSACHADAHEGQFARGAFAGQECTACHSRQHFSPHEFTVTKHDATSMPLTGKHVDTECNACHERATPQSPRAFQGTPAECAACHADAHDAFFQDELVDVDPLPDQGECAVCHVTTTFREIPKPGFDHPRFTDFALLGAHAQEQCTACHVPTPAPDETGRTFGRVAQHFGEFRGCVTCHEDVHAGLFDRPDMPATVENRTDCARCHDESSFRALPHGFEHGRWTGFQLVGAHVAASCSACHEPVRATKPGGRTWSPAMGSACSDCHVDPHAGQFAVEGATDCARCHTDALDDYLSFNHDRDSRFPLREQHEAVACASCHRTTTAPDGNDVVHYKPLGTECVDCHGVQEDVLMKRKRRRGG